MSKNVIIAFLLFTSFPMFSIAKDHPNNMQGVTYDGKVISIYVPEPNNKLVADFMLKDPKTGTKRLIRIPYKDFNEQFDLITDAFIFNYDVDSYDVGEGIIKVVEMHIKR